MIPSRSKTMTVDNFMQEVFDPGTDLLHMNMRIIGDMSYIQSKDMRSVATGIPRRLLFGQTVV